MYEGMEMRKVLVEELVKYMKDNDNIIVLDADLGKASGTIAIKDRTNNRHFEAGIAEANMVSIAAGLSSYGFIPFVSSFTPFATRRVADQIAISCAYAKQNVRIIGTDPGIAAEYNGGTHMSMEDVAIVRGIPNVVIFEPVDKTMLVKAMPSILEFNGTMYIRLWRKNATDIFDDNYKFDLFKGDMVKVGKD
ncbi:MAG: transketolase family protein, partial [Clostridia bacterium]